MRRVLFGFVEYKVGGIFIVVSCQRTDIIASSERRTATQNMQREERDSDIAYQLIEGIQHDKTVQQPSLSFGRFFCISKDEVYLRVHGLHNSVTFSWIVPLARSTSTIGVCVCLSFL